jgi:hypothetical protein
MRLSLLGLLGAAALGLGAVSAAPAQAQGLSITIGEPYGHRPPPPVYREHRREFVPVYRYRHVRHRDVPPHVYATGSFGPSRCIIRTSRTWDGYGWVERRRRICR